MKKINLKNWFIAACIAKALLVFLAVKNPNLSLSILALSLIIVLGYAWIGYKWKDESFPIDKVADSCYYLGFIFTITSIIGALVTLNTIENSLSGISALFGAAMVSTLLGIVIRIYLIGFRVNTEDALKNIEDSLLENAQKLTEEIDRSFCELTNFRSKVLETTRESEREIREQVQRAVEYQHEQNATLFAHIAKNVDEIIRANMADIELSTKKLAQLITEHESSARKVTNTLDENIDSFIKNTVQKLKRIDLPEDIFSKKLELPLMNLSTQTSIITEQAKQISDNFKNANNSVFNTVKKINEKSEELHSILASIELLKNEQSALLISTKIQQEALLEQIANQAEHILNVVALPQSQVLVTAINQQGELNKETNNQLTLTKEILTEMATDLAKIRTTDESSHNISTNISKFTADTAEKIRLLVDTTKENTAITQRIQEEIKNSREENNFSIKLISSTLTELGASNKSQLGLIIKNTELSKKSGNKEQRAPFASKNNKIKNGGV